MSIMYEVLMSWLIVNEIIFLVFFIPRARMPS
jgi:hypothetical protein